MKRLISAMLAVSLMVLLTSCGTSSETKKFIGTWTHDVDVTERMNTATEQVYGISAGEIEGRMQVRMVFTVAEDGSFVLYYDEDAVRASLDSYVDSLHSAVSEGFYSAAEEQGFTREEYDESLAQANISIDSLIKEIFNSLDTTMLVELLTGQKAEYSGYCTAKDGKLYMAATAEELANADYVTYTFNSDGTMSWTDEDGQVSSQLSPEEQELFQFPMVWTKQAA